MPKGIGIAGIGFMGTTHFHAISRIPGTRVTAIATRDKQKWTGDWRHIKGNFGGGGGQHDLSDIAKYETVEAMARDPKVQLVDICLPTHLHKDAVLAAIDAGKHVLVEKPIALTVEDAADMMQAADDAGVTLQVGHVLKMMSPYEALEQTILNQTYGSAVSLTMKRAISRKNWDEAAALRKDAASGGPVIDLLIHDVDFVRHVFGMPRTLEATGYVTPKGHIAAYTVQMLFQRPGVHVTITGGAIGVPGRSFEQGYDLYLENAFMQFHSVHQPEPRLIPRDGEPFDVALSTEDPFVRQLRYFVDTVAGRVSGDRLNARGASESLQLCLEIRDQILNR